MKIVVTGGAGFIGSNVVDALISKGNDVFIIDNFSTGKKENIHAKAKVYAMDITDAQVSELMQEIKPHAVFHFAARIDVRKSVADPKEDARVNILGSINIIESAYNAGCKKFIFASSGGAIYGDTDDIPTSEKHLPEPMSPYGITKLAVEYYLQYYFTVFRMPYVALRFANVYGQRQNAQGEAGVVAIFCDTILRGEAPRIYGDGKQTRDFVFVEDICAACLLALELKARGAYNVGTSVETDINSLAEIIKNSLGYRGEILHSEAKKGEQERSCLNFSKIKKELGWSPKVNLKDGILQTVQWFSEGA